MSENTVNPEQIKLDICCVARLLYRQGLSVANAEHLSVAIVGIPAFALLWKYFLTRLKQTDADLFEESKITFANKIYLRK